MLKQGTNRLNQGHDSDGSGWGSEWTGLVRAWWMLTHGSVRAQTEVQLLGLETLTGMQALWSRRQWKLSSSRNDGGSDTGTQGTASLGAQGTAGRGRM